MAPINYRSRSRGRKRYRTPSATPRKRTHNSSSRYSSYSPQTMEAIENLLSLATGSPVAAAVARTGMQMATQTSRPGYKKFSGSSRLGGFAKATKKNSRKTKRGKFSTKLGLQKKGICYQHEIRHVQQEIGSVTIDTSLECIALAHNSLPVKITHANLWRAVVKMLCSKLGLHIRAFTNTCVTFGFIAGDLFRVNYYLTASTPTLTSFTVAIGATSTFDDIANAIAGVVRNISTLNGVMRWDTIDFVPTTASKFTQMNIRLTSVKVEVMTQSHMKVQNRTVDNTASDEADDVNNVPLNGKFYQLKGNNALHESNRALLPQMAYDTEMLLYSSSTRAPAGSVTNNEVPDAPTSVFLKQAEPPQPFELKNCFKHGKIRIGPGDIKTSTVKHHQIYNFVQLINILSFGNGLINNQFMYNSRAGNTNLMYLEKVIGNNASSVLFAVEVDFKQWIACTGSMTEITEPLQIQESF